MIKRVKGAREYIIDPCDRGPTCNPFVGGPCIGDDKFQCSNGRCIKKANVCDAYCDCLNIDAGFNGTNSTCEDEQDCDEYYSVVNGKCKTVWSLGSCDFLVVSEIIPGYL